MYKEDDTGCIFEDTPHECTWTFDGRCVASSSYVLRCVQNHLYNAIKPEMVDYVVGLFRGELEHTRRTIGRKKHANS